MTQKRQYIWQLPFWPKFRWEDAALLQPLGWCRFHQGALLARMRALGFEDRQQARAEVMVEEALKTAEIEGERLDPRAVRSSVAMRLGLQTAGLQLIRNQHADGVIDILLDATQGYETELTAERLFGWHAALFPSGYSGLHQIRVAAWRDDRSGPMRVVSGPIGREKIHYQALPAESLDDEMDGFLRWWEESRQKVDGLLRAGIAHLWFVAVHPFEDGNGRIARSLTEMALAQDETLAIRYYSLSSQIMAERESYYRILERTNTGDGDITGWMLWFLDCMTRAILQADATCANAMQKSRFWQFHARTGLSDRQRKVINRLLEAGPGGFEGGMTNRKYAGIAKVSRATAQRELADLVRKGVLGSNPGGGRSTSYDLVWDRVM
jgi:Fic family protein